MTVRALLARIDSQELTEWAAYFGLEPWGTEVEDWRAGLIASTIANANRDPKKRREAYQPQDFMPKREPKPEQDAESHKKILEMWSVAWESRFGGDS